MYEAIDLELTEVLKNHGFSRIAVEANTLVVMYNGGCARCDIENSWNKTMQGFKKYAKDLIPEKEILQALISFISEKWLELQEKRIQQHQRQEELEKLRQEHQTDDDVHDAKVAQEEEQDLSVHLPPNINSVEHAIQIIQRNVKGEDHNIRIVLYADLSSHTFNPLSVAIRAPTSQG